MAIVGLYADRAAAVEAAVSNAYITARIKVEHAAGA